MPPFFVWSFAQWMPVGDAIVWGLVWTLGLYAIIWSHEMGHIAMGRRCGIDTDRITLRALGGLAHLRAPAQTPVDEMKISLAGPATHLLWMAALYPLVWLLGDGHGHERWFHMLGGFAQLQLVLLVFNLLPVFPLDGGSTLRGALALRMNANRASFHVATVGFVGNGAFVLLGLVSSLKIADPFGFGPYGFFMAWIGISGIQECRQLRMEAKYGDVYGDHDPFQKTLLASQAAMRDDEREELKERDVHRTALTKRRQLQETADRLLDRINELGGIDKLSSSERKELERVSRVLAQDD